MTSRFALDGTWRRPRRGTVVIVGSPLVLFRLTDAGVRVAEALEVGAELPTGHEGLTERFLDAGAVHPVPTGPGPYGPNDVTVVVPTRNPDPDRLDRLVTSLGPVGRVVVVDDASDTPVHTDLAELVRLAAQQGPGGARQAGLARITTPLVAFVDDDVNVTPGWLDPLLAQFGDDRVGLVAPRVLSTPGTGALARFDEQRSPLDLGPEPARVRSGTRVSYVPAAALVCRTDAIAAVAGFDPTLRFGEDVDLVWRLDEQGWRCRYEPAAIVRHRPRATLATWGRQRFGYGSSAAPLALRHPNALAPVRMSGWSLAVWGLVALGHPVAGVGLAGGTIVALARKLQDVPDRARESARLAGLGHLVAGRQLASAVTRAWWPIAVLLALVSRRARRALLAAATIPALADWVRQRPRIDPVRYAALRLLDDAAYGAGVWAGCLRHRTWRPLVPDLTPFPARGDRRPRRSDGHLLASPRTR